MGGEAAHPGVEGGETGPHSPKRLPSLCRRRRYLTVLLPESAPAAAIDPERRPRFQREIDRRTGKDREMSEPFDSAAIVAAVRAGDRSLFMRLVEAYGFMVRSHIGSQVYNPSDIDDLAQETFIAAYRGLADFRLGDDFGAWLRGIARNRVRMYFRSRQRRLAALERFRTEVVALVEHDLDREAEQDVRVRDALLGCVAKLPDRLRRVVHAGLQGARVAQLCDELGVSAGAIYQLHYRANQLLRACLKRALQDHA